MFDWNRGKSSCDFWKPHYPSSISYEVLAFDAILGRTLLLLVDMKVTKDGTEFVRRTDSQKGTGPQLKVQEGKTEKGKKR